VPNAADAGAMTPEAAPIEATEAARLLAPLAGRTVLLAVSGGPDSTAMLGLAAEAASTLHLQLHAATVDHRLRDESLAEARGVARFAASLAIPHQILPWAEATPGSGLQERAREARINLLTAEAQRLSTRHIALAHTLDDQAETLLMRIAAGTGLHGAGGMAEHRHIGAACFHRPFLDIPKARLVATCKARGWPFVADPSNHNPEFARSRWRALAPLLAAEGLTAERLALFSHRLRRADEALDRVAHRLMSSIRGHSGGFKPEFLLEPPEIALRVMGLVMEMATLGRPRPLRLERLERLTAELTECHRQGLPCRRTLAGVVITLHPRRGLRLAPEGPRSRGKNIAVVKPN
jgi:tRNA(Ile)-lysidine synthase